MADEFIFRLPTPSRKSVPEIRATPHPHRQVSCHRVGVILVSTGVLIYLGLRFRDEITESRHREQLSGCEQVSMLGHAIVLHPKPKSLIWQVSVGYADGQPDGLCMAFLVLGRRDVDPPPLPFAYNC